MHSKRKLIEVVVRKEIAAMSRLLAMLFVSALVFSVRPTRGQETSGVPAERLERLSRGINLPYWFWYPPQTIEEIEAYYTVADLEFIREQGFTFVRMPIDLTFVMDENSQDLLWIEHVALVDRAIQKIMAADLAVIVDLHSTSPTDADNANYSGALEDPAFFQTFKAFWRSFATYLSAFDPNYVILEPMNEPVFEADPSAWVPLQVELVDTVRKAAPEHTIIATGALWSNIDTLLQLEPLDDPNIIYNFHFYDPFVFTHQGAEWSSDDVKPLRNVPYPSSPEAIESAELTYEDALARQRLEEYGAASFNAETMADLIRPVAEWAEAHGVPVICGEFGTYKLYAPADARAQWVNDVRTTLESFGIGWSMWEYDGSFGMVTRLRNGETEVDTAIAAALGLTTE
jgi:endoglucanase